MIWDEIAAEAAAESSLWVGALRPLDQRRQLEVFSPLAERDHGHEDEADDEHHEHRLAALFRGGLHGEQMEHGAESTARR